LKLGVDDEVNRIGECLPKVKLVTEVALFHKLKMITRAVVWGQVKAERCVAKLSQKQKTLYLFYCQHPGRVFLFQKKGFEIRL